jgi:hypothetical protein
MNPCHYPDPAFPCEDYRFNDPKGFSDRQCNFFATEWFVDLLPVPQTLLVWRLVGTKQGASASEYAS